MIELQGVTKTYAARSGPVEVLKGIELTVRRGDKLGILGRNGAGKSTLIRLIGGIERPTTGAVTRSMQISWPLAFTGAFQTALTGIDNVRFICRIYGRRFEDVIDFVEDFSQLGRFLKEPVRVYSSGMRMRLAFAISLMIDFDCYLIDEVVAVGDARFQQRSQAELFDARQDRAIILVSHDATYVRSHCDRAAVLHEGRLTEYENVDEAIEVHSLRMTTQ
jgi:capsular polysaccharide transport system ATP-binding protein